MTISTQAKNARQLIKVSGDSLPKSEFYDGFRRTHEKLQTLKSRHSNLLPVQPRSADISGKKKAVSAVGVIVLFARIDTVTAKNPFWDKNLEVRLFAPHCPFHADWYASA